MSWPRLASLSIALNVLLLGGVAYSVWTLKKAHSAPPAPAAASRVVTNTITQVAVRKVNTSNFWATLMASRSPSWNLVESTNYVTYIENLRTIGCPEETIKDIIIADIAKLYSKKRAAIRAQEPPVPFWKSEDAWNASPEKVAFQQQLEALDNEQKLLVKQLLDADFEAEIAKYIDGDPVEDKTYDFLPGEKRDKVLELQRLYAEAQQKVYDSAKGVWLDEDYEQLRLLEKQKEAELAKVLSPEELEEYQLRSSSIAQNLRSGMVGFEASQEEFRQLFRLQKTYEAQFDNAFNPTDEKQLEMREKAQDQAQEALQEEMKKTLGEKRYNEYQRAQDIGYRSLAQLVERYQGSSDIAAKVYEMKLEAERQKRILEANLNLTPERRLAAANALAQETRNSIAQALGGDKSKIWNAYQNTGGQWMDELSAIEIPEPVQEQPVNVPQMPPLFPPFPPGPFIPQ